MASNGLVHAIIETPRNCVTKIDFDVKFRLFRVAKVLPAGMHFPFNFGFIPGTLAEDGDPIDVLVLCDQPLFAGCLASVSLIGALEAGQSSNQASHSIRNDRLIAVLRDESDNPDTSFSHVSELPSQLKRHTEAFFVQYNQLSERKFKPLGWRGPKRAHKLLKAAIEESHLQPQRGKERP